jgi:glycine cleavage system H protein
MLTVRGCPFPADRYYDAKCNVWLMPDADGHVLLGATAFGVALAGEFIEFVPKAPGTRVDAGRAVGLLEIAKSLISVRTPVAATVIAGNAAAVKDPMLINRQPYGAGWLLQLQIEGWNTAARNLLYGPALVPAFEAAMTLENFSGEGLA